MDNETTQSRGRHISRCKFTVSQFDNRSPVSDELLVPAEVFEEVNRALEEYVSFIKKSTIPTENPHERFVVCTSDDWFHMPNLLLEARSLKEISACNGYMMLSDDHPLCKLVDAIERLESKWTSIVQSAGSGLAKFLPTNEELWNLFGVRIEILKKDDDTLSILGPHSLYYVPPPPPPPPTGDALKPVDSQEYADLEKQLSDGQIDQKEYDQKLKRLSNLHESWKIYDKMRHII